MSEPWNLSLFDDLGDDEAVYVDAEALAAATTHQLDDHSWITHARRFVLGHRPLLSELSTIDGWEQRRRWMYNRVVDEPRLTNEFRDISLAPLMLRDIGAALSAHCGVPYDGIWMNWYRDHRHSTSWHADRPANVPEAAVVPVVSLGDTRRFLIRPVGGGPSATFVAEGGDVLIMHGRCQRDWQHCVPKQKRPAAARMSLNFTSAAQVMSSAS